MAGERGPDQTTWVRLDYYTNSAGKVVLHTNLFVELGAGINRRVSTGSGSVTAGANAATKPQRTSWVASTPEVAATSGGAQGSQGRHQVVFASNIKTKGGVLVIGPDGRKIRSHVLGLSYYDAAASNSVLIADVKSSIGQILPSKRGVLYADAFKGVKADVRYTYTAGGVEQDVILREQPPAPEAYGLDSKTTELEVLTEYLDAPTRHVAGASDDAVEFGAMRLAQGRAFSLKQSGGTFAVGKHWAVSDGRQFLIESVSASAVQKATAKLGKSQASIWKPRALPAHQFPAVPGAAKSAAAMELAKGSSAEPGFVLDWYITLGTDSVDSYTFRADTMYLITDVFAVTNATFEGGTVIKFGPNGGLEVKNIATIATQFEPVTFTSQEDGTISWDVSTGTPIAFMRPFLSIANGSDGALLPSMHFRYAATAVALAGGSLDVWDCQFVNCYCAIQGYASVANVALHNVLFGSCTSPIDMYGLPNSQVSGEQVTADAFAAFCTTRYFPLAQLQLTNSIFTGGGLP